MRESPNSAIDVEDGFPEKMTNWFLTDDYEEDIGKTYTNMTQGHGWEELQEIQSCKVWS